MNLNGKNYNKYSGKYYRKIGGNSWFPAYRKNGLPATFVKADGTTTPIYMGPTAFIPPEGEELFKGENGKTAVAGDWTWCFWIPKAKSNGKGITIYGESYRKIVEDRENHQNEITALESLGIPLDINIAC